MHQYKELIDDIDIKYIEMPNKLEWVILGSELYVNSKLSSSSYVREDINTYYVLCEKQSTLTIAKHFKTWVITLTYLLHIYF